MVPATNGLLKRMIVLPFPDTPRPDSDFSFFFPFRTPKRGPFPPLSPPSRSEKDRTMKLFLPLFFSREEEVFSPKVRRPHFSLFFSFPRPATRERILSVFSSLPRKVTALRRSFFSFLDPDQDGKVLFPHKLNGIPARLPFSSSFLPAF